MTAVNLCHFQGYPQPIVTWYNNDLPIPHNQGFITQTENYSILTFSSVLPQNEGSITCVLFNQYGTVKTTSVLKVKSKQRHALEAYRVPVLQDYTDEEEELMLVFDQEAKAYPPLRREGQTNLHMLKTNTSSSSADTELLSFPVEIQITAATPTPEQDRESRDLFQLEELEPKAMPQDEATRSPKHKFVFSSDITNEPPEVLQGMPQHARCREGDSIVLECLLSGEPKPAVTWFHNGVLLRQNQKFQFEEINCCHRLYINDVNSQILGNIDALLKTIRATVESVSDLTFGTCH